MRPLTIGTRSSALALRQTEIALETLRRVFAGTEISTKTINTEGDRRDDLSLEEFGGQGVFVKDIEADLLSGAVDIAVHSLKDMPAEIPSNLTIAAVLPRADVRDALVSGGGKRLADLPAGARVGTDSRRRSLQLLALRPDLQIESIRGNVDTRVKKTLAGEIDAVVLAMAGLERLGLTAHASQVFEIEELLPAVGQGVIALEGRKDDYEVLGRLRLAEDIETRMAITAERAFLRRLGAGCRLPVGAFAYVDEEEDELHLRALLGSDDGKVFLRELIALPEDGVDAGYEMADNLLAAVAQG
jgi:hydroxymethylbilane synthase